MLKVSKIKKRIKKLKAKPPKLKFVYAWFYKHCKVNEKQVLFESFHGKDISDSPLYILYDFIKRPEAKDFTIYFATNNYKKHKAFIDSIGLDVKLVDISTYKYTKVLATSKYLINNSSFPAYFIRRPEQVYLQTWHGTPLKTLGKKMRMGIESMYNVQHNFIQANYIMHPNAFTRDVMMEDYNLNDLYTGTVVMNGYPRNVVFQDRDKDREICHKLGNENFTTLAYMPTWRGKSNHDIQILKYNEEINKMLKYLDEHLKDNQKFYVNFHPIVQSEVKLDNYKHIFPFPADVDKYEFLNSVDALVTDYSSVFFDYSVTRKPVILFMYDYEEYLSDRGMYFDIKELPFTKIYNIKELTKYIVDEKFRNDDYSNDTAYINKYIQYDDADAAKRMVDLVFHGKTDGLECIDYSHNKDIKRKVIFYPNVKMPEALDTVYKNVNPKKDVVLLERKFFNPKMSSYLYDNYADKFQFMFITRTLPRTWLEEWKSKKNKALADKLHEREIKRVFGDLPVEWEFEKEYYVGEENTTYFVKNPVIKSAIINISANRLNINFMNNVDLHPEKIFVASKQRKIFWMRDVTDDEKNQKVIHEDFEELLAAGVVKNNNRFVIGIEEETDGKKQICYLTDIGAYRRAQNMSSELDRSYYYIDEISSNNIVYSTSNEEAKSGSVTLYYEFISGNLGALTLHILSLEKAITRFTIARVVEHHTKGSLITVKAKLPVNEGKIEDMVLSYRSVVEDINYSFKYKVKKKGKFLVISGKIDIKNLEMQELFWDMFIKLNIRGQMVNIKAFYTPFQKINFTMGNYQAKANEHILFPYSTIGGKMAYTYRKESPYDGWNIKFKEMIAFGIYAILHEYWKRKRVWLVYEKFCSMAQDNGYYFFKYCMEELSPEENKHIYYVLDKNSGAWPELEKKYGKHVIPFMSVKHMLYSMVGKLYIASDSKKHLYTWRAKPNLISNRIANHKILFLQHGVTALKRVDGIFGKKGTSAMTYFTTTSEFEQQIVIDNFKYSRATAPVLGFTRWDVLEDKSKDDEKIILAMPTWRTWLEEKSAEEFKRSDYYENYMKFLQDKKLGKLLKENNVKLIFYIHPKFQDYLSEFNINGENVELIPFGAEPLNEIMMKCHMLITDYSSVCWDVYYMGKPVLFYQFDYDMYMLAHGSYLDMEHDLFGERYTENDELISGIEKYIKNGFKENERAKNMRKHYFEFQDSDNSKRTYQYIIKRGF